MPCHVAACSPSVAVRLSASAEASERLADARFAREFSAGHGGSSARYDALHDTAFDWAFLLWQVGISR